MLITTPLFWVSVSTLLLPWQSAEVIIVSGVGFLKVLFLKNLVAIVYYCHSFYYVPVMV